MAEGVAKEQLMVTEREAAKLLGLCARSLWSLRHSGGIRERFRSYASGARSGIASNRFGSGAPNVKR
jgi:hypothetical protein